MNKKQNEREINEKTKDIQDNQEEKEKKNNGEKKGYSISEREVNDMKHLLNLKSPVSKTKNRIRMLKPTSYPIVVAAAGLEHATSRL